MPTLSSSPWWDRPSVGSDGHYQAPSNLINAGAARLCRDDGHLTLGCLSDLSGLFRLSVRLTLRIRHLRTGDGERRRNEQGCASMPIL